MLKDTFSKLSFEVVQCTDLDKVDFFRNIQHYANNSSDCFVCCILSHGTRNVIISTKGENIKIDDLLKAVSPQTCPRLIGAPKLFFIQACQGITNQRGMF